MRGFASEQRVELLHEIEVLDRAGLALPAALLPARRPLVDRVHAELAVGVDDELASVGQGLEGLDQRRQLHAVVGRVGLAAVLLGDGSRRPRPRPKPQPPGPGFGSHEPSVKTPVFGSARIAVRGLLRGSASDRWPATRWPPVRCRRSDAHAEVDDVTVLDDVVLALDLHQPLGLGARFAAHFDVGRRRGSPRRG